MSFVRKLTVSRKVLLDMLTLRGFDLKEFQNFSPEEINVMYKNSIKSSKELNPIDFSLGKELIVKYLFNSKPRVANVISLVESMIEEDLLDEGSSLILLLKDPISNDESLEVYFEELHKSKKIFVQYFWLDNLTFNVLEHQLVPNHVVLNKKEQEKLLKSIDIKHEDQLPYISKKDPVAKFLGMKTGQICRIERKSETAGKTLYYRLCKL